MDTVVQQLTDPNGSLPEQFDSIQFILKEELHKDSQPPSVLLTFSKQLSGLLRGRGPQKILACILLETVAERSALKLFEASVADWVQALFVSLQASEIEVRQQMLSTATQLLLSVGRNLPDLKKQLAGMWIPKLVQALVLAHSILPSELARASLLQVINHYPNSLKSSRESLLSQLEDSVVKHNVSETTAELLLSLYSLGVDNGLDGLLRKIVNTLLFILDTLEQTHSTTDSARFLLGNDIAKDLSKFLAMAKLVVGRASADLLPMSHLGIAVRRIYNGPGIKARKDRDYLMQLLLAGTDQLVDTIVVSLARTLFYQVAGSFFVYDALDGAGIDKLFLVVFEDISMVEQALQKDHARKRKLQMDKQDAEQDVSLEMALLRAILDGTDSWLTIVVKAAAPVFKTSQLDQLAIVVLRIHTLAKCNAGVFRDFECTVSSLKVKNISRKGLSDLAILLAPKLPPQTFQPVDVARLLDAAGGQKAIVNAAAESTRAPLVHVSEPQRAAVSLTMDPSSGPEADDIIIDSAVAALQPASKSSPRETRRVDVVLPSSSIAQPAPILPVFTVPLQTDTGTAKELLDMDQLSDHDVDGSLPSIDIDDDPDFDE
ncbi:hypothetical protein HDU91_007345 [Kappamyces sp. JEL0680]|nr:hypothetical protein HDU91_007345 [Kappamyces sp. JEL0680]